MEGVKTALSVSIAARAVAAVSGLLALPVYLGHLGVEAYGVVGLFASMQAVIAFMEFGLATTLTRLLARASLDASALAQARDATLTFERAYLGLAIVAALLLAVSAPWIASTWVNLHSLTTAEVTLSLQLAAVSLAFGWPTNLYSAGLAGLHRQVPLAISTSAFAILRVSVTILCLWHVPTLESFFWAQLATAILQALGTRIQLWRALVLPGHRPVAQWRLLVRTRKFAGGMTAITVTSILLTQTDKLILSHILPLSEFGTYAVALSLSTGLYILISPMFSVIYPRISAAWGGVDTPELAQLYHASSQAMAALVMPLAAVLACFPAPSLYVLTNNPALSAAAASILVFLVIGAALNGIMNIPYALQLAAGWTSLSVWLNIASLAAVAPLTWWAATRFGAVGGAAAWSLLNAGHFIITPILLHRRLLKAEKWRWYRDDVLTPGVISFVVAMLLATMWQAGSSSRWLTGLQLAACWLVTAFSTLLSMPRLRLSVTRILWR